LSVGKRSNYTSDTPSIGTGGGQKAKSKDVAAGEEAISPTELGVWVPTQLEIGLA
jgi:hypothetical protein